MSAIVSRLCRYPVKGLSTESLGSVTLEPDQGIAGDRRYALALSSTTFDPANPQWMPKTNFLMLMRHERLAALETRFDEGTGVLTVLRDGKAVTRGDLRTPVGRGMVEEFFAAYMGSQVAGKPKVVAATGDHMFSDHSNRVVSIINLATVRDLERVVRSDVDPLRFRANVYVDEAPAWSEFDWVDRDITIGDARLHVTARIDRCAATNVRPGAGTRDMNLPRTLQQVFGHVDCGVYARVESGGTVSVGDRLVAEDI